MAHHHIAVSSLFISLYKRAFVMYNLSYYLTKAYIQLTNKHQKNITVPNYMFATVHYVLKQIRSFSLLNRVLQTTDLHKHTLPYNS